MKLNILVADDQRLIREPIGAALELAGYEVELAKDGTEALAAIRSGRPRLVLLDLEMPGMSGMDVLQKIGGAGAPGAPKFIVLTATQDKAIVLAARAQGIRHFMLKSAFSLKELLDRIKLVLAETAGPNPCDPQNVAAPATVTPPVRATHPVAPVVRASDSATGEEPVEHFTQSEVAERLRSLKPLMSRDELMKRVLDGTDLRALAPSVRQVLTLTASTGASLDDIAKAIKQDQALSLKVLKVANSPVYAHADRVESVQKAVGRIGVAQIRTIVQSLSVIDQFSAVNLAGRVKAEWFWEHSLACGLIASRLARIQKGTPAQIDAMFTAGLLHDVGRMIFAERLGEDYGHVIDTAEQLELPLETVESRLLMMNHADLTDRLLRQWHFSPELINPIALHHLSMGNIRRMAPRMVTEVATLAMANRMAHALVLGCSGNDAIYPMAEFIAALNLSPADVAALCTEIPEQTQDLKLTMMFYGGGSKSVLEERCGWLGEGIRPVLVALRPDTSAFGILLSRLCAVPDDQSPNIIVLRVSQASERAEVMNRLKEAEVSFGIAGAPVLVLGNGTGCLFADGALGGRAMEQLVVPLRQSRLIRSLRQLIDQAGALKRAA
ncbi:MAG: HDOD domain-containing protein [Phycisphaeraceae bacterium]|nr:HDOD domain-containing protein [Phycisphaeraceae bacterium]